MKIVIEISDKLAKSIAEYDLDFDDLDMVCDMIKNGTPLPEHHGDLIDRKALKRCIPSEEYGAKFAIENAPTIIPAAEEKSCENCANWNEHYGTADCIGCHNRELWTPKQTAMKEGDGE